MLQIVFRVPFQCCYSFTIPWKVQTRKFPTHFFSQRIICESIVYIISITNGWWWYRAPKYFMFYYIVRYRVPLGFKRLSICEQIKYRYDSAFIFHYWRWYLCSQGVKVYAGYRISFRVIVVVVIERTPIHTHTQSTINILMSKC